MKEYKVIICQVGDLRDNLNSFAQCGWVFKGMQISGANIVAVMEKDIG